MTRHFHNACIPTVMAAISLAAAAARAETRHLSLPSYVVQAGTPLDVPLTLDNAAGMAGLNVQVNFDPSVLTLQSIQSGPLGDLFERVDGQSGGTISLTFARAQALGGGSGRLASLRFIANSGANVDLVTDLAIARFDPNDETGVIDLRRSDTLAVSHGKVTVTASASIDNAGNGIPDWWEQQHELDLFSDSSSDQDGDGLNTLFEFAFGGNPKAADAAQRAPQQLVSAVDGESFLTIGFFRRTSPGNLLLNVQESPDLAGWSNLDINQRLVRPPQDMGDGTEYVEVRGSIPMTGPTSQPHGYLRVLASPP